MAAGRTHLRFAAITSRPLTGIGARVSRGHRKTGSFRSDLGRCAGAPTIAVARKSCDARSPQIFETWSAQISGARRHEGRPTRPRRSEKCAGGPVEAVGTQLDPIHAESVAWSRPARKDAAKS
jgi:hypothetical protein